MKDKYYITTAIAYTSSKPHIGNTYEAILADSIARFKRADGYDVFFQTGTDEHGQKIEDKAKSLGKTPKELVDKVAGEVKDIWDLMGVSYDKFSINSAKSRFGSCSSKKTLNFSYRLMLYPYEAIEYVCVHELAHLIEMNHSKKFWAIVEAYLPDYKARKKLLKRG